ncbi:MAG: hypothetical protein EBS86_01285 [Crocinitomicaceae bacterium]|nr:hypothetical protein [Crocinitomicaceae bacterium]
MKHLINAEMALPATIYRVSAAEKTIAELRAEVNALRISLTTAVEQIKCSNIQIKTPETEIIVPKELVHSKGKRYMRYGKMVYGRRNRNAEQVAKRWSMWKTQLELGISMSAIARAWNCDHSSILHAKKKGFKAYAKSTN